MHFHVTSHLRQTLSTSFSLQKNILPAHGVQRSNINEAHSKVRVIKSINQLIKLSVQFDTSNTIILDSL